MEAQPAFHVKRGEQGGFRVRRRHAGGFTPRTGGVVNGGRGPVGPLEYRNALVFFFVFWALTSAHRPWADSIAMRPPLSKVSVRFRRRGRVPGSPTRSGVPSTRPINTEGCFSGGPTEKKSRPGPCFSAVHE